MRRSRRMRAEVLAQVSNGVRNGGGGIGSHEANLQIRRWIA